MFDKQLFAILLVRHTETTVVLLRNDTSLQEFEICISFVPA